MIVRSNAPLIFANAESVLRAIADKARQQRPATLILSLEESNDLDSTAVETLDEFIKALQAMDSRLILARAHDRVRDILRADGQNELASTGTYSVADAAALASKER